MSKIEFICGQPGSEIHRDLVIPLFSDPLHQGIHPSDDLLCFYGLKEKESSVQCWLCCVIKEGEAYAPWRAPYGGYHFNRSVSMDTLNRFMKFCEEELVKRGVVSLHVGTMPEGPYGNTGSANYLMWSRSYSLDRMELHGFIRTTENYAIQLITDYQRRLRLSREKGFSFKKEDPGNYREIHSFILDCRKERGQQFSMDLSAMEEHVYKLGDKFRMYSVYSGTKRIASGIFIRVTEKVLYDFTHAHPREYDKYSPIISLLEGVNNLALKEGFRYIDLGSSSLGGKPNMPLFAFKKNLGAKFYPRAEYSVQLK